MSFLSKNAFTILVLVSVSTSVLADHITIKGAWLPEAAPVARVMAAYMDISNHSKQTSFITSVTSPQFKKVEIHSMSHKNGMMHMEKQEQLKLPAGKTVALQPGGFHMMLFNPKEWFKDGSKITLNITLDNKETFQIIAPVIKETGNDSGMQHHNHH